MEPFHLVVKLQRARLCASFINFGFIFDLLRPQYDGTRPGVYSSPILTVSGERDGIGDKTKEK